MGQKVHPFGIRLGIIRTWNSRWFAGKPYADMLHEDLKIRKSLKSRLALAGIARIEIERVGDRVRISIHAARPGIIIGKKGVEVDNLKKEMQELTGKQVAININEVKTPELDAQLLSESVASQIEKRVSFRRAMKKAVTSALKAGAKGIKVMCAGRLGGSEISRTEWYRVGRVPLQTFRADIDYGLAEARCTYGVIGVKVWIFTQEIFEEKVREQEARKSGRNYAAPKKS